MILTLIVALLGFPIGILIALMTKEELEKGKRYFRFSEEILFFLIVIISLIYLLDSMIFFSIILALSTIVYLIKRKLGRNKNRYSLFIPYISFITSYYLINNLNLPLIIASLIFIYGLLAGTLYYESS